MRPAVVVALALALIPAASAKPRRPAPPAAAANAQVPAPHAALTREADGVRADLSADGPLLGWAAVKRADGGRTIFVLIGPRPSEAADASCRTEDAVSREPEHDARLFRWDLQAEGELTPLRSALPHGSLEAADLDGDGRDELLLLRDGAIDAIPLDASSPGSQPLRPVVRDAALGRSFGDPRAARSAADASDGRLRLSASGEFVTYGTTAGGAAAPSSMIDLPVHVVPGLTRIDVRTPEVVAIGPGVSGRMLFATWPESAGGQRLRTVLLEPEAPAGDRSVESWAQLPGAERMIDSVLTLRDGHPVLVVTTMSAEKLDIFAEKKLRVFALGGDRTRAGGAPQFAATTGMNLWQPGHPVLADLDRDGRDDLVIGYWKGLKRSIAALEVYRGEDGGAFAKKRTMEIDVKDADEGFLSFGSDADGDGRPDLVVVAGHQALVFPGTAPGEGAQRPVAGKPSRRLSTPPDAQGANSLDVTFELGEITVSRRTPGFGTPRVMDLDGDGRVELVFAGDRRGSGGLSVLSFRGEGASPPRSPLASSGRISYK